MQGKTMHEEVTSILARMDGSGEQDGHEPTPPSPPESTEPVEDIYVFIVREHDEAPDQPEDDDAVIDTTLAPKKPSLLALAIVFFALLLPLASIALQLFLAFHPFIATITILPKSRQVTLAETLQLGRLLHPVTLSESATAKTTGTGHQDATQAHGFITFYNGEFTRVTVPAGTILTGANGVHIITDQDAAIPAGNPPSYGQVTISAHAAQAGTTGNIQADDINQACCFASVLAKNPEHFTGGQDARDYQTVAKADIDNAARPLQTALSESSNGAFHGQLTPGEKLIPLPCSPAVSPDHHIGEAAATVTVTVSQTCRAVAYETAALQKSAAAILATEGKKAAGAHYRLIGTVQVTVLHAGITGQARGLASIMVHIAGVWGYQFTQAELHRIAQQIAGKPQEAARTILRHVPGIQSATIAGIDETMNLPRNTSLIHFAFG